MHNTKSEPWCKLWICSAGRNINNLRYADDTSLMAESEEELKSFLMKVKEESEKVGWKLSIQKTKIMASGPITSWEIHGETVETVSDFIWVGAPKSLQMVIAARKLKDAHSLEEKLWQPGVWVNSWSWWWTGRPGVLQFMGSQKVGHDWVTELSWTVMNCNIIALQSLDLFTPWTLVIHILNWEGGLETGGLIASRWIYDA